MASGAVNTATNVASAATNAGTNVAQNLGQAGRSGVRGDPCGADDTSVRGWFGWWGAADVHDADGGRGWRAWAGELGDGWRSSVGGHADIVDGSGGRRSPAARSRRLQDRREHRWRRW